MDGECKTSVPFVSTRGTAGPVTEADKMRGAGARGVAWSKPTESAMEYGLCEQSGAGLGCGSCKPEVQEILSENKLSMAKDFAR